MTFAHLNNEDFITSLTELILSNLEDEHFTAEDLASKTGMQPRALNRRLLKLKRPNINKLIREIRLQKSLELLEQGYLTAAEIAYKTGFGSPSYFIKCFHEHYGYPPGKFKSLPNDSPAGEEVAQPEADNETTAIPAKKSKLTLFIAGSVILLGVLAWLGFRQYLSTGRGNTIVSEDGRIALAVFPFRNMTGDSTWNIWQEGIQDNMIASLSDYKGFKVLSASMVNSLLQSRGFKQYTSLTPEISRSASRKLEAGVFILGSILKADKVARFSLHVINARTNEVLTSYQKEGPEEHIMSIIDTLSWNIRDFLEISKLKTENSFGFTLTKSPEAYKCLVAGAKALDVFNFSGAIEYYLQAYKIDSNLYEACDALGEIFWNIGEYKEARKWLLRSNSKQNLMDMYDKIIANLSYAYYFISPREAMRYAEQLIQYNDQDWVGYVFLGDEYYVTAQFDKAIPPLEKVIELKRKFGVQSRIREYWQLSECYHRMGYYTKERKLLNKGLKIYPNTPLLLQRMAILEMKQGNQEAAEKDLTLAISGIVTTYSDSEIAIRVGDAYTEGGKPEQAEKQYRKAYLLDSGNLRPLGKLAYFLIDKNRGFTEGMTMINQVLEKNPGDYKCLEIKGWGLYKQGNRKEALRLLERADSLKPIYDVRLYLHLAEVKRALAMNNQ